VELGLTIWFTPDSIRPVDLARAAEERGFESLFLPQHTHIPVARTTPFPGGGELPREYTEMLDPFTALAAAAAVTSTLLVGTAVCLVTQHDPIVLAKETATIDLMSGGRFVFGVGAGRNLEEIRNHGTDPARRWQLLRERVEAITRIWQDDAAEYHGELVDFDPIWSWPKPVQRPRPPILVGGTGPHVIDRVLAYGDGWIPSPALLDRPLSEQVDELQARAAALGRGPVPVTMYGAPPTEAALHDLDAAGVSRAILNLPPAGRDTVLRRLDAYSSLITP
jgi:probable F420-dependent oxidoreductase